MNVSPFRPKLVLVAVTSLLLCCRCQSDNGGKRLRLLALDGSEVDPLAAVRQAKATVFLFTRTDCPISNRLAPEVHRLFEAFSPRGVEFYLVYPDPAETPDEIRQHLTDYSYRPTPLRDVHHDLVKRTAARVTPEASVFAADGALTYHGRINDRFVDYGKTRAAATRHDLEEAIQATLEGRPLAETRSQGVGCPIPRL
jgi:hypothetical protein